MKIKVKYFALFREQSQKTEELLETSASSLSDLYNEVKLKYHFHLHEHQVKVAINDEFSDFSYLLKENDQVVFIPPVAGG